MTKSQRGCFLYLTIKAKFQLSSLISSGHMLMEMSNNVRSREIVAENLRKQLAVAVRSVQWSYAIFWSLKAGDQGVLEWTDGYYNGDIKTRKTVSAMELVADKIGLQRSEQLRELYQSLLEGEIDQQVKRQSAALSPEDLSDAEWYYLVCMSFAFSPGQDLPGRALASKQTIWLCDAQYADSKVFSRSLLAKSASVQTVVCFPHFDGVIEIGVTDLVSEDPGLIQHIKASLLDFSKPSCCDKSSPAPHKPDDDREPMISVKLNHDTANPLDSKNVCSPTGNILFDQEGMNGLCGTMHEEFNISSPNDCSNGCEENQWTEDSFMLEGSNGEAPQVQSWDLMDEEFSNGVQHSINNSNFISTAFVNQEKGVSFSKDNTVTLEGKKELQEGNRKNLSSMDLGADNDLHYRRTLSVVFKKSPLIGDLLGHVNNYASSFAIWNKNGAVNAHRPMAPQAMLKKVLFAVPSEHGGRFRYNKQHGVVDCLWKSEKDEICKELILAENQKENEKFLILQSMIPSISKRDNASILNGVIKYLKELEAKVEELESCMDPTECEERPRKSYLDMIEQSSNNYEIKKIDNGKKPPINKRKAGDVDDADPDFNSVVPNKELSSDVKISVKEKEVLIEMRCPYREYILLDIINEINNLHMDVHSIQSSNLDGILSLTLISKFRERAVSPVGMIKRALSRISCKY